MRRDAGPGRGAGLPAGEDRNRARAERGLLALPIRVTSLPLEPVGISPRVDAVDDARLAAKVAALRARLDQIGE